MVETDDLVARLRGRAAFLHECFEVKSPELLRAAADEIEALRKGVEEILAAQIVQPYRGWNITKLNKAADHARELLGLPSVRELNPDIAAMQDHAAENADAIRALLKGTPDNGQG